MRRLLPFRSFPLTAARCQVVDPLAAPRAAPCRVVLIDDSLAFLTVAGDFVAQEPGIVLVGRFVNAGDALREMPELAPDLVVTDLMMPGLNGLDAVRQLRQLPRPPRIIVVSLHDSADLRARLAAAGADAFLPKDQLATELPRAIRRLFPVGTDRRP
jgi:DNA-binding NarL/FixJ family response regulator